MARRKHIPQRMCIACRESQDKKNLIRIVRTPQGIMVDETGKLDGRGAYLHSNPVCWEKGVNRYLAKALNVDISSAEREELLALLQNLPEQPGMDH